MLSSATSRLPIVVLNRKPDSLNHDFAAVYHNAVGEIFVGGEENGIHSIWRNRTFAYRFRVGNQTHCLAVHQSRPCIQLNSAGSHSSFNKFVATDVRNATMIGVR